MLKFSNLVSFLSHSSQIQPPFMPTIDSSAISSDSLYNFSYSLFPARWLMNLSEIFASKISSLRLIEILWAQSNLWKKARKTDKDYGVFSPLNFYLKAYQLDSVWLNLEAHILSLLVIYQKPSAHFAGSTLTHFKTSRWNLPDSHFLIFARPKAYIRFPHYLCPQIILPIPDLFSKIHSQLLSDLDVVSSWQ